MATIRYQNVSREIVKLSTMSNLGHEFLGLHEKGEIPSGGERGTFLLCGLRAAKMQTHLSASSIPKSSTSGETASLNLALVTNIMTHKKLVVVDYSQINN